MNDASRRTLALVAELLASAADDWWIIAGAALVLHGVGDDQISDVDVLLSERDARLLFDRLGLPADPGLPDDRFRSRLFGRWTAAPLPIELMAGLEVHSSGRWMPVAPHGREPFKVDGARLFAPGLDELRQQLRLFGREKDMRRAAVLG